MRLLAIAAFAFIAQSVLAAPPRLGVVESQASGDLCVTFGEPRLDLPKRFVAAFFDPPIAIEALAVEGLPGDCSQRGDLVGAAYRARQTLRRVRDVSRIGIAVTDGPYVVRVSSAGVHLRPRRGKELTLKLCASSEGLHLTAWRGPERIWHEYYYLGYDVEPTCSEAEWRD